MININNLQNSICIESESKEEHDLCRDILLSINKLVEYKNSFCYPFDVGDVVYVKDPDSNNLLPVTIYAIRKTLKSKNKIDVRICVQEERSYNKWHHYRASFLVSSFNKKFFLDEKLAEKSLLN